MDHIVDHYGSYSIMGMDHYGSYSIMGMDHYGSYSGSLHKGMDNAISTCEHEG